MSIAIYTINKGINRPVEFKGFKAQYIWYLGGGLLLLLFLFVILYICGVHPFICLGVIVVIGVALFIYVAKLSHRYGQFGLMKKRAKKALPHKLRSNSRKLFIMK